MHGPGGGLLERTRRQDAYGRYIEIDALHVLDRPKERVAVIELIIPHNVRVTPEALCNQLSWLLKEAVAANLHDNAERAFSRAIEECSGVGMEIFFDRGDNIVSFIAERPTGRSILFRLCHGGGRLYAAIAKAGLLEIACRGATIAN